MDNNGAGAFGQLGEDVGHQILSAALANVSQSTFSDLGLGFDDSNPLESFDFDSFLHVGDDSSGFGSLGAEFGFGELETEAS